MTAVHRIRWRLGRSPPLRLSAIAVATTSADEGRARVDLRNASSKSPKPRGPSNTHRSRLSRTDITDRPGSLRHGARRTARQAGWVVETESGTRDAGQTRPDPSGMVRVRNDTEVEIVYSREILGLQVNSGNCVLMAVAAMSASYARAAGLRPARRRLAAIGPNARAAAASKGSGSKSDSASWR